MIAIAVKLDSRGPIFFRQQRVGYGNRLFMMYKFRSMKVETSDARGGRSASRDDDRITRVGRIIPGHQRRRTAAAAQCPSRRNERRRAAPHALGSLAGISSSGMSTRAITTVTPASPA